MGLKEGDRIIFVIEDGHVIIRKAAGEKISETLRRQKPWRERSLKFQKRICKEWQ